MRPLLLSALLVVALSGCKGAPATHVKAASEPTLPSGWKAVTSDDGRVSLAVAEGWRSGVDAMVESPAEMGGMMPGEGSDNPNIQALAQGMAEMDADAQRKEMEALKARGIVVHIIAPGVKPIPGEARTRYQVKTVHADANVTLAEATERTKEDMGTGTTQSPATLPIGPATRFVAHRTLKDGGIYDAVAYVVVDGPDTFVLKFITEAGATNILPIEKAVAESWRIKPGKA